MPRVEIRRHATRQDRDNNLSHLSQAGIEEARRAGESAGPFDLVVTSPLPRAIETAVAMGFAVDETARVFQELEMTATPAAGWDAGYLAWCEAYHSGRAKGYADHMAAMVKSLAARVPENGAALVVTHGGLVEACAIGCAPDADHRSWGGHAGYAEGVSLEFARDGSCTARVLRLE